MPAIPAARAPRREGQEAAPPQKRTTLLGAASGEASSQPHSIQAWSMPFVVSDLRRFIQAKLGPARPLQLRQALLVRGEVHRQLQLVHAQLARAFQHGGEIAPSS